MPVDCAPPPGTRFFRPLAHRQAPIARASNDLCWWKGSRLVPEPYFTRNLTFEVPEWVMADGSVRQGLDEQAMLGSGLIDQSQKMTAAAMQMAEKKVWAHRWYRVAMRRQSLSLPNMFSILWRWR